MSPWSSPQSEPAPVIVGAGPVGCVLALTLAHHGVPSVVVERRPEASQHPKMDYISGRSMEHLRRLGLADAVRELAIDDSLTSWFRWCADLGSPLLTSWEHPAPADYSFRSEAVNDGSSALEPYLRVQGSTLETWLRERVLEHPLIDLQVGLTVVGLVEDDDEVVLDAVTAHGERKQLRADYVAACDGAGSRIRAALGIPLDTAGVPRRSHSIYFRSRDERLRPWGPTFITVCGSGVTLVSRDENELWTASFPVGEEGPEDPVARLRQLVGVPIEIDEVLSTTQWTGSMSVAQRYRVGRTFLVGDAAHQFFPTGGHGVNTGISDAVDLAWKIAATLDGTGGPRLLDSYECERRPVALLRREMSANLLEVWQRFRRLCQIGAPPEVIAGFLDREGYQHDNSGVHFGDRYVRSPIIVDDGTTRDDWSWDAITASIRPGRRLPSLRLADRSQLHDRLSDGFTLVDATPSGDGRALMGADLSAAAGVSYLPVTDRSARQVLDHRLVLVRADHHVAWSTRSMVGEDWPQTLARVSGR